MKKRTLILGATTNPERYAFKAAEKLLHFGHSIYLLGNKKGTIQGNEITEIWPEPFTVNTVTLYLNAEKQKAFYEAIITLNPKRVIFNPGTENEEFIELLKSRGIESEIACTLVLLAINEY